MFREPPRRGSQTGRGPPSSFRLIEFASRNARGGAYPAAVCCACCSCRLCPADNWNRYPSWDCICGSRSSCTWAKVSPPRSGNIVKSRGSTDKFEKMEGKEPSKSSAERAMKELALANGRLRGERDLATQNLANAGGVHAPPKACAHLAAPAPGGQP